MDETRILAREAYVYLFPLVLMDVTRRQATNVTAGEVIGRGPANFRDVVRPNFDTLYSIAWLDLTREPLIVSMPDTSGRYYLLSLLDMWTDVFACPGKRTTGTAAQTFAVVPPSWNGKLPPDVEPSTRRLLSYESSEERKWHRPYRSRQPLALLLSRA